MDFFFILVLYKTNLKDSITFITINEALKYSGKKATFFIYDNSPKSQTIDNYDEINLIYTHDSKNSGLSVAYNLGAQYAREKNIKWITLLDQDTSFSKDFLNILTSSINNNQNIKMFAPKLILVNKSPFSPTKYKWKRGYTVDLAKDHFYDLDVYSPVNSGLTIDVESFWKAGGYNEDVFLDFADFQFVERFRMFFSCFYLINSIAVQDFSNDEVNVAKLNDRFKMYCQCAKACENNSFFDKLQYFYAVTRHCLGLVKKSNDLIFVKTYYKYFLL